MSVKVVYAISKAAQLTPLIATDINDPMFDAPPRIADMPDGSIRVSGQGVQYAGGMACAQLGWPDVPNLAFAGLDYEAYVSAADLSFLRVLETDLKACLNPWVSGPNISNVANWSVQKNLAEGGMWQIDDVNGNWIDTGFNPGPLSPDVWVPVSLRFSVNWTGGTYSVLSISESGKTGLIQAPQQNIALLPSNWGKALNAQLPQTCLNMAGAVNVQIRNALVTLSDEAF